MMADVKRITRWVPINEDCNSRYGHITGKTWIENERDRINQGKHMVKIVTRRAEKSFEHALYFIDGYFEPGERMLWIES